ncbi:MAG: class I SAM-dependent methyltransferase [Bacteroidota bacterium]
MPGATLNQRIQHFYDESTHLWLDTWGEHMHHGFYGSDGKAKKGRQEAQIDLIESLLSFGQVKQATNILDAGCGVGGSARYLAKKYKAQVLGMTLSPVQAKAAKAYTEKADLSDSVRFKVQDMMTLEAEQDPFDLVWSMESAEHIADKPGLFGLFHSRMATGGQFVMATWCHRNLPPDLSTSDQKLLSALYRIYNLPPMCSEQDLDRYAAQAGFANIETADWSDAVAPFWGEVIRSALEWKNFKLLMRTGTSTLAGAWAMRYMRKGYQRGLIRFVVIKGQKI